jgi:hypothetical protein
VPTGGGSGYDSEDDDGAEEAHPRGDHDAFGELFDACARSVHSHTYRFTGDWAQAEDVVSLTFLDARRLREKFDEEGGGNLPKAGIRKGQVLSNTAVLRRTVVDKAGRRP